ncbi:hypothetical protein V8F06_005891 [Rhypophila decipiens]
MTNEAGYKRNIRKTLQVSKPSFIHGVTILMYHVLLPRHILICHTNSMCLIDILECNRPWLPYTHNTNKCTMPPLTHTTWIVSPGIVVSVWVLCN